MTIEITYTFYNDIPRNCNYDFEVSISLKICEENDIKYVALFVYDKKHVLKIEKEYEQETYNKNVYPNLKIRFDNYYDMLKKIYPVITETTTTTKIL